MIKTFRLPVLTALAAATLLSACSAIEPTEMAFAKPSWTSKCEELAGYQQQTAIAASSTI